METETLIQAGVRSIEALAPALAGLEECSAELDAARAGLERGHFTPAEDELLQTWFARHLTARAALLETIEELKPLARGELAQAVSVRLVHAQRGRNTRRYW